MVFKVGGRPFRPEPSDDDWKKQEEKILEGIDECNSGLARKKLEEEDED